MVEEKSRWLDPSVPEGSAEEAEDEEREEERWAPGFGHLCIQPSRASIQYPDKKKYPQVAEETREKREEKRSFPVSGSRAG